jgi:type II restriction enzyme
LQTKNPAILSLLENATPETFRELDFRRPSWSSTTVLQKLASELHELKEQIRILHKRDYLSITPKVEDLALVNRWIQNFGVPHYYLQVFFDKAYVISFKEILEISSNPDKEDIIFSIERDVKNQGKTTIKINIQVGREIIGKIEMPKHKSVQKELERGRLLFYVTFEGGSGYLDARVFNEKIIQYA